MGYGEPSVEAIAALAVRAAYPRSGADHEPPHDALSALGEAGEVDAGRHPAAAARAIPARDEASSRPLAVGEPRDLAALDIRDHETRPSRVREAKRDHDVADARIGRERRDPAWTGPFARRHAGASLLSSHALAAPHPPFFFLTPKTMPEGSINPLIRKLNELSARFDELRAKLNDPAILSNHQQLVPISRESGQLEPIVTRYRQYQNLLEEMASLKEMSQSRADAEMAKQVAEAEGQAKSAIERDRGEAEANRLRNASITPQLLQLKRLENERARIEKWNGDVPRMVVGEKNGLMLQMPFDADHR